MNIKEINENGNPKVEKKTEYENELQSYSDSLNFDGLDDDDDDDDTMKVHQFCGIFVIIY